MPRYQIEKTWIVETDLPLEKLHKTVRSKLFATFLELFRCFGVEIVDGKTKTSLMAQEKKTKKKR